MNTLSDAECNTYLLHEHQPHTQAESLPQLAWLTQLQCGVLCSYPKFGMCNNINYLFRRDLNIEGQLESLPQFQHLPVYTSQIN
jgi:hypothetical protein